MAEGYIALHRKLLEWEWYDEPNVFRLYMHCLLRASHKPIKYRGIELVAGQFTTSLDALHSQTGLSIQQIRTAFKKLKSTGEVTSAGTSKCTVVTVNNWDKYQTSNKRNNKRTTSKQQTSNKHSTTINNVNNVNNKTMADFELPIWVDQKAWGEFVQHRKDIRKPLKSTSAKKNLAVLEKHKTQQKEIIDATIANAWTGLFPPKGNSQDKRAVTDDPENEYNHYRKLGQDLGINPTSTESNKEYIIRVKEKVNNAQQ